MCISAFAKAKNLSEKEAFNYLNQYKGIDFLIDCYDAEHVLSMNLILDLFSSSIDKCSICIYKNMGASYEKKYPYCFDRHSVMYL